MKARKHGSLWLVLAALPLAVPAQVPEGCNPFDDVAILATNSVHLNQSVTVDGDVVANDASPGPVLDGGVELSLEKSATLNGDASADSIARNQQAAINGAVECNDGSGVSCSGLALPVFDELPPFVEASIRPEAEDVNVAAGQTVVLAAGEYGDLTLAGTVVLDGAYEFRSILGTGAGGCGYPCATIVYSAPTEVSVEGRFTLGKNSCVAPGTSSGDCPAQGSPIGVSGAGAAFYVGGDNLVPADPSSQPPAARTGRGSVLAASFYAPNGTFWLDRDSVMRGAVIARDVRLDRGSKLAEDTYFLNKPPTADAQTATTGGAASIDLILTGSDPDGGDVSFAITASPTAGSVSTPVPIVPPASQSCSIARTSCTTDADCPSGETCDSSQAPITSASVTYTPAQPALEEEDAFEFSVTDACNLSGSATVTINPFDPSPPEPGPEAVDATDVAVDTTTGTPITIPLAAGGPDGGTITFSVESLPTGGALQDSAATAIESVPYALPDGLVTYTPGAGTVSDSFLFGATDGTTSDTATASVGVVEPYELAPDQQATTAADVPVQVTLVGLAGGVGTGQRPQAAAASGARARATGAVRSERRASTARASGAWQVGTLSGTRNGGRDGAAAGPGARSPITQAGPFTIGFGAGWSSTSATPPAFFWGSSEPVFADDGPFNFTGAGCVSVTDDFRAGDEFRIYDNGQPIGTTSSVAEGVNDIDNGPDVAFADPAYSSGSFLVGAGSHSITIEVIANPFGGGRAYLRVDTECIRPNLVVASFSAPSSALLDEAIGDEITTTIQNVGTANIPPGANASIGYYISQDATITTDDRLLSGGRESFSQQVPGGLAIGVTASIDLFDGANASSTFPDENVIVGDVWIGVVLDEFNDLAESDEGDNTAAQSIAVSQDQSVALTWEILTLPAAGTGSLTTLQGSPVTVGQTFTAEPTLLFTPVVGFSGSSSFTYQVAQGAVVDNATLTVIVEALGSCLESDVFCNNGRGGGGGQAPETLAAGSPTLSLVAVGGGTVTASRFGLGPYRRPVGCGDRCSGRFAAGETVLVTARASSGAVEFAGWQGDCSGDGPLAFVSMNADKRCVAVFRTVEE